MSERTRKNSRQKGALGEREFAALLQAYGYEAKRGQQHAGGADSPDVICPSLEWIHFEVKRVQAGNPYDWLAQATRDAGVDKMPVVAHRRNHQEWIAVLPMEQFLQLLQKVK
jgi:Holliday junction resolvase